MFVEIPGTEGSDFFLRFKGEISRLPPPFSLLFFSLLGLLPGPGPKPTLNESCRGESSPGLMLPGNPLIPGRLKAAAVIFFVVAGVEGGEPKVDADCGPGGGAGAMEGEGGVERFRRYSGGVWYASSGCVRSETVESILCVEGKALTEGDRGGRD